MGKPKVSVIVPIYNVEPYLQRCVNSILCQTLRDIEIILVDDGSTDNSASLCDDYAKADSRVTLIHQKNTGLSGARNAGLYIMTGEYVSFIDGDDCVLPDMLESMLNEALGCNADAVMCNIEMITQSGSRLLYAPQNERIDLSRFDFSLYFSDYISKKRLGYNVCCMLYRTSILQSCGLRFSDKMSFAEDIPFNLCFLAAAKSIKTLDKPFYLYYRRPGSLTAVPRTDYFEKYTLMIEIFFDFVESGEYGEYIFKQVPGFLWEWLIRAAGDSKNDVDKIVAGFETINEKNFLRKQMLALAFGQAGRNYCKTHRLKGKLKVHFKLMAFCIATGQYEKAAKEYFSA